MNKLKSIFRQIKNLSRKKKFILLLIMVGIGYYIYQTRFNSNQPTYQFTTVEKGTLSSIVSESGEIVTTSVTNIKSTITGIVTDVLVENGQTVTKETSLVNITSTATEQQRTTSYSNYLNAKNNFDNAQSKLHSLQSAAFAANQKFINDAAERELEDTDPTYIQQWADWKQAEENYINQNTAINQTRVAFNNAWLDYQSTTDGPVKATADGIVANLSVALGQQVDTDTSILLIKSNAQPQIKISLTENDITQISPGLSAEVTIDALPNNQYTATVTRVDEIGTIKSGVVTYNVYLAIEDQDITGLRPAMTANVDILTQQKDNILLVPNSAVKPYQGGKAVQVLDTQTQELIYYPITVGIVGDTQTEIINGIDQGQQIITNGANLSNDNQGGGFLFGSRSRD